MTQRSLRGAQRLLFFCGLLLLAAQAHAASPTQEELQEVQNQLARARAALDHPDLLLEEAHSRALSSGLKKSEAALQHYLKLSKQGKKRTMFMAPLAVAGTTLVADDVITWVSSTRTLANSSKLQSLADRSSHEK